MARQPVSAAAANDDAQQLEGFPEDGDAYDDRRDDGDAGDDAPASDGAEPRGEAAPPWRAELDAVRGKISTLEQENARLRAAVVPMQPRPVAPPADAGIDWEKEVFENPREALRKHGEIIKAEVKQELTQKYERDQGAQKFWNDFYSKHGDLKDDHDLVQQTLESNFAELSPLAIEDALAQLADKTRERILRYASRGNGRPTRRVRVEGAAAPSTVTRRETPVGPTSLSSIIRARNSARRPNA